MSRQVATFGFGGGLDTNSAALATPPGAVISSMNYEPLAEGYGRVQGYERFDGRAAPSAAAFWAMPFDNGSSPIVLGDTITGDTSGATAVLIAEVIGFSGDWDDGDAAGTLLLTAMTGAFADNEILNVGGTPSGQVAGLPSLNSAVNHTELKTRRLLAQNHYRDQIGKVPGEGPVRGVAVHKGEVYAWRNNVGSTQANGWKATPTGWQALPMLKRITFAAGLVEPNEGDILHGDSSGAAAILQRVVQQTGDWGSTAVGYFDIEPVSGTFASGETLKVGATPIATGSAAVDITLPPGGRYRTLSHNFYGNAQRYRLYGVNGVGNAFEMLENGAIGTIPTGMETDTPTRIFEISNHLGLIFPGGSIQFCAPGEPRVFDVVQGAGEIGFGTEVTDVVQSNETAVAIFGESKIAILSGHDADDFAMETLTEEAGADADTAQRIARTVYLDARGLRSLDATQAYGNFKAGTLSGQFERYFRSKRAKGATPAGSFVCKGKSQYRLVWNDGTGLSVYMGGKHPQAMTHDYGDMRPYCFGAGELADGEGIFVGGEDGYVYRLDSGNSFDGDRIKGFVMTPFNHMGAVAQEKRYHKVVIELDCPPEAQIAVTGQYDYGDGDKPISGAADFTVTSAPGAIELLVLGGGGIWDSAIWNEFYWSAPVEGRAECPVDGLGRNASFIFASHAHETEDPHILQAYLIYYSQRKLLR